MSNNNLQSNNSDPRRQQTYYANLKYNYYEGGTLQFNNHNYQKELKQNNYFKTGDHRSFNNPGNSYNQRPQSTYNNQRNPYNYGPDSTSNNRGNSYNYGPDSTFNNRGNSYKYGPDNTFNNKGTHRNFNNQGSNSRFNQSNTTRFPYNKDQNNYNRNNSHSNQNNFNDNAYNFTNSNSTNQKVEFKNYNKGNNSNRENTNTCDSNSITNDFASTDTVKEEIKIKEENIDEKSNEENDKKEEVESRRTNRRNNTVKKEVNYNEEEEESGEEIEPKKKIKMESSDEEYIVEENPKKRQNKKSKENIINTESVVANAKPKATRGRKRKISEMDDEFDVDGIKETKTKKATVKKAATKKTALVKKTTTASKKASQTTPKKKAKLDEDSNIREMFDNLNDVDEGVTKQKKAVQKRKVQCDDTGETSTTSKTKKKPVEINQSYWTDEKLLAEMCDCEPYIAWNFIKLIESDNTIPFIARYRKEQVNHFEPEKLREMKQNYDNIKEIHHKANTIINKIESVNKLTADLRKSILCCKSLEELELVYSPYKVGSKGTKAEKAKKLGLEQAAIDLLNGIHVDINSLVDPKVPELNHPDKVKDGIQHIIADVIAKDTEVLERLQELVKNTKVLLESTKTKQAPEIENFDKYETYFNFSCDIKFINPHQVLAINRGESQKVLSVNVKLNDWLKNQLFQFCRKKWLDNGAYSTLRAKLFEVTFEDSFKRLIKPFITRSIRTQLNQTAEIASIQVFASNLKEKLLVPPMRGSVIMAIDPGYSHGCKTAVIDIKGNVLVTDTLYIKFGVKNEGKDINAMKLRDMVLRHKCELIAVGNGTACRETETYLSDLIQKNWFDPLNVCYTIISEQGASIYSCSNEAKKEFPNLDPNVISAISLARRLQDPLSELVKVEPKHLGVGMYQHDLPEKQLGATLNEVVSECVSYVGVDVNCVSHTMLRRIAGLTDATAKNIIEYRNQKGCFNSREELRKVKGIGEKRFEQCAGFIRISFTGEGDSKKINPLDSTWIHPESYDVTYKFLKNAKVNLSDLGTDHFISSVSSYVSLRSAESLSKEYGISESTMNFIIEALQKPKEFDLRSTLSKPLFKKGIQTMDDVCVGTVLSGKVNNVTHFGCFVDVGLGRDALIHISKLRNVTLKFNNKVSVKVIDIDRNRKRISLELIELLE